MKFIQLFSTIATVAIFATAPGVSAAGLRAAGSDAVDERDTSTEDMAYQSKTEYSGRRNLQAIMGGPMVGAIYTPGTMEGAGWYGPGPAATAGGYGSAIDYDNSSENYFYNRKYNHGYGVGGYGEYKNRGHRGHGGHPNNRNWFCGQIQTQDECEQHDRDHQCGWDEHHYPRCHVY